MAKQKQTEEKESNKGSFRDRYKKCLSELKKIPTVNIKGKKYLLYFIFLQSLFEQSISKHIKHI